METLWNNHKFSILAVFVLLGLLASSIVIVPETKQAVIIRTGEPVRNVNTFKPDVPYGQTGAGMVLRIPLIETVQMIDKRVLDLDMERQQVLSNDQQRLQVDAFARFRIIDPDLMVETAGTEENVMLQLQPILTSVLRQELGRRPFSSLLTAERGDAMRNIREALDTQARQYGAQVIDVRIKRADLPEGTPLDSAFQRMEADRQEEAETIRAQGRKNAQIIRAEAEATAARTYAEAYGKDPDFYDFYRAMQSYRTTFESGQAESSVILSPDNEYLRQFRGRR
ncbi:protease modulator HflC [Parerythrobacter jejuensis]|uniref:Protein HflC n=1 Tax=Parerythrobacter jejuensis TaxID=795812 RepID=A0A845ANW5_9SPHN|nr:protease modulator HflC [Parerythrobacter jejuensis]MXP31304.1 protease modulator HflC [Parerythrobacter jejuensis]MXP34064.1 protease modulator HflC [Parerythrobacter jejuensis]